MPRLISFIGLLSFVGAAYLLGGKNRKHVRWKTVISGIFLQVILGLFILKTELGRDIFSMAKEIFTGILNYTNAGSEFIFGELTNPEKVGFLFFTMVLPTILFMSSLMSILYHIGIMQIIIKFTSSLMMKLMGTSGSESLACAANIFAGQTEAPLVVKPYIETMTESELLALMTGGMATVAGGVLAAYVGLGIDAGHLLAASVMSAPASLVCAKLILPETEVSPTGANITIEMRRTTTNLIDAAATGAADGLKLALNVGAMLLAFIALIAMFNGLLGWVGSLVGLPFLSLEWFTGHLFAPVAFLMGVPWAESIAVGSLLGKKLIVNEFVAYLDLQKLLTTLSPRSITIATYALCGFANFSSIAIQVGGIGTIAPGRRQDLARLGIRSLVGGTIACFMTACIAGMFI